MASYSAQGKLTVAREVLPLSAVAEAWQRQAYFRLRRDIFEREQGLSVRTVPGGHAATTFGS